MARWLQKRGRVQEVVIEVPAAPPGGLAKPKERAEGTSGARRRASHAEVNSLHKHASEETVVSLDAEGTEELLSLVNCPWLDR